MVDKKQNIGENLRNQRTFLAGFSRGGNKIDNYDFS
jgi:hypothetical protein